MSDFLFDLEPFTADRLVSRLHATKQGTFGELVFAVQAFKNDYSIWNPLGHAHKADIIIWRPPQRPVSVQVKTLSLHGSNWQGHLGSVPAGGFSNENCTCTKYQVGEVDVLAFYLPPRERFALYHVSETQNMAARTITWREGDRLDNWHLLEEI